jgi:predicted nucleic acid-binding protein
MKDNKKAIILDANILIRAVLGVGIQAILQRYENETEFYAPHVCFADARKYLPTITGKPNFQPGKSLKALNDLEARTVLSVDRGVYAFREQDARERIQSRDPDDWPVVATALALNLPIWTEDRDFFGCGAATWITNTVEIYLRSTTLID